MSGTGRIRTRNKRGLGRKQTFDSRHRSAERQPIRTLQRKEKGLGETPEREGHGKQMGAEVRGQKSHQRRECQHCTHKSLYVHMGSPSYLSMVVWRFPQQARRTPGRRQPRPDLSDVTHPQGLAAPVRLPDTAPPLSPPRRSPGIPRAFPGHSPGISRAFPGRSTGVILGNVGRVR